MSRYGDYYTYGGGRNGGSPYTSHIVDPYARNLSSQFEYIDADHDILHDAHRPTIAKPQDNTPYDDPEAPDLILVRYMASVIPVQFPAYSISEEKAYVGQLREAVARALSTDPRRVRLVYKKRDLKHDSWPLRKYNMKQNSEVAAIKTEGVLDYSDRDSPSSSDQESVASQNPRRRPRALSSVRDRSNDQIPTQKSPISSNFLSPNGHIPSTGDSERQTRGSLRPDVDDRTYRREPSRTRGTSPRPTPTATPSAPSARVSADPNTPLGKLQALSDTFHDLWLPLCQKFISNPPSNPQDREKEHRKLSESIMLHVLLKADAIDVDNSEARAFRKALINETNDTMKRLDAVAKA